jgi:hypothetical protein
MQEIICQLVAGVRIAHPNRLACHEVIRKVLALIDVEDRVLSHHGNKFFVVPFAILIGHAELLHEMHLRAMLPFADVAANLNCLLKGERPRRRPATTTRGSDFAAREGWTPARTPARAPAGPTLPHAGQATRLARQQTRPDISRVMVWPLLKV